MRQYLQIILWLLLPLDCAAESATDLKQAFVDRELCISYILPDGYTAAENRMLIYSVYKTKHILNAGFPYTIAATSSDSCALLLYADAGLLAYTFSAYTGDFGARAHMDCVHELAQTLDENDRADRHITTLKGSDAACWNADSAYVVDFPKATVYQEKYTHCIGLYIMKHGYIPVYLKCLLTDDGYQNRAAYMAHMRTAVKYRGAPWTYDPLKIREAHSAMMRQVDRLVPEEPASLRKKWKLGTPQDMNVFRKP